MKTTIIVACDKNRIIGVNNNIPWNFPDDQKRFKEVTTGSCVVMGSKTWQTIPGTLIGRTKIIVSKTQNAQAINADRTVQPKNFYVSNSIERALRLAKDLGFKETFIAGGSDIYRQTIELVDAIDYTLVPEVTLEPIKEPLDIKYFPQIPPNFKLVKEEINPNDNRLIHFYYEKNND